MEGVWATIFICHLIFGGHLLNIPHIDNADLTDDRRFFFIELNKSVVILSHLCYQCAIYPL